MDRIKLRFSDFEYRYFKEDSVIVCKVDASFVNNDFSWIITETNFIDSFTVTGKAKCHPDDKNNQKLGRHLAESRAKRKAYHKAKIILENEIKKITKEYETYRNGLDFIKNLETTENEHIDYLKKES